MTIYKANKFYGLPALIIPLLLIIPVLNSEVSFTERMIGFGIFMLVTCIVLFIPFGAKLEVGKDYVKNYFFGFCTSIIKQEDIVTINYGNLFRGGLGYGKGLNIRVKKGFGKNHSIGEKLWGKEAIEHIRRVLEKNNCSE